MSRQGNRLKTHAKLKGNLQSWLIMLPGLILMTFFVWEPLFESIRMSLYKTRNVELVRFVGFDNFISVMGKSNFLQALTNTFSYTFWSLLIGFFLPILLAMLIGETVRGKGFFRIGDFGEMLPDYRRDRLPLRDPLFRWYLLPLVGAAHKSVQIGFRSQDSVQHGGEIDPDIISLVADRHMASRGYGIACCRQVFPVGLQFGFEIIPG